MANFANTVSVKNKDPPCHPHIPQEQKIEIFGEIIVNPHNLQYTSRFFYQVSSSTVWRTLKRNKLYPYEVEMVHQLIELEPDQNYDALDTFITFALPVNVQFF